MYKINGNLEYYIMDPTGNITALVNSPVEISQQPAVADEIMKLHPEVEQVGFVRYEEEREGDQPLAGELRMAGGEFCGNASLSAGALCLLLKKDSGEKVEKSSEAGYGELSRKLFLKVSGASGPVEIRLEPLGDHTFYGGIHMPEPLEITEREFIYKEKQDRLPVVTMEGISHIIIPSRNTFSRLLDEPADAEEAVRQWCDQLGVEGLGLMFLNGKGPVCPLIPLVYIPGSNTVFWENSCASGTAATGMYIAWAQGKEISLTFEEPGGRLRVENVGGETWLYGNVGRMEG